MQGARRLMGTLEDSRSISTTLSGRSTLVPLLPPRGAVQEGETGTISSTTVREGRHAGLAVEERALGGAIREGGWNPLVGMRPSLNESITTVCTTTFDEDTREKGTGQEGHSLSVVLVFEELDSV